MNTTAEIPENVRVLSTTQRPAGWWVVVNIYLVVVLLLAAAGTALGV
jgi:hypothetical protein